MKNTFLNLQILYFLPKKFCHSRLRDLCKVSLASFGFIGFSNHKKRMALTSSVFKFFIVVC